MGEWSVGEWSVGAWERGAWSVGEWSVKRGRVERGAWESGAWSVGEWSVERGRVEREAWERRARREKMASSPCSRAGTGSSAVPAVPPLWERQRGRRASKIASPRGSTGTRKRWGRLSSPSRPDAPASGRSGRRSSVGGRSRRLLRIPHAGAWSWPSRRWSIGTSRSRGSSTHPPPCEGIHQIGRGAPGEESRGIGGAGREAAFYRTVGSGSRRGALGGSPIRRAPRVRFGARRGRRAVG